MILAYLKTAFPDYIVDVHEDPSGRGTASWCRRVPVCRSLP